MLMAKALKVSRADAYTAVADVWAMLAADAEGDIVKGWTLEMLDAVVEMEMAGCGTAMLQAGLVGVVDDGIVLPAELRRRQSECRGGQAAAAAEDHEDRKERERKEARIRKRRSRAKKALTTPASKDTSVTPAEDKGMKQKPVRLGTVDNFPVMLLWSRAGVPFYKIIGASPKEWTGTVTDQERPSYADALVSLHAAMKREDQKGLGGNGDNFRPSLNAVVAEAERYRTERAAAAVDDARRDEANRAAAEAAAEDREDIDHEPAERDCHAHVTPNQRDAVTVTDASRPESVTCPPNSHDGTNLEHAECHAHVTVTALSSSSFSSVSASSGQSSKETTTTTNGVTPAERDHEDRILDRLVPRKDPVTVEREQKRQELAERFAAALKVSAESVIHQWRTKPDTLLARLLRAGIDPNTGLALAAEASHKPIDARDAASATTEPTTSDKPAAGSVDTQGDDERKHGNRPPVVFACSADSLRHGLQQHGVPLPRAKTLPAEDVVLASDYDKLSKVDRLRNSCGTLLAARELGADVTAKAAGVAP
jgi:hypothetical protein